MESSGWRKQNQRLSLNAQFFAGSCQIQRFVGTLRLWERENILLYLAFMRFYVVISNSQTDSLHDLFENKKRK